MMIIHYVSKNMKICFLSFLSIPPYYSEVLLSHIEANHYTATLYVPAGGNY